MAPQRHVYVPTLGTRDGDLSGKGLCRAEVSQDQALTGLLLRPPSKCFTYSLTPFIELESLPQALHVQNNPRQEFLFNVITTF